MNNRHSDVDHHNDHEDETRELDARPTRTSLSPNPAFTFSGGGGGGGGGTFYAILHNIWR